VSETTPGRVDATTELYGWLNGQGHSYVVLSLLAGGPIDLLVDDALIAGLNGFLSAKRGRGGPRVRVYGVEGADGSDYLGFALLPEALARRMLRRRIRGPEGCYAPSPEDHADALAYRLIYQQSEQSGIHWRDPAENQDGPGVAAMRKAMDAAGLATPLTQRALHNHLVAGGFGVTPERLRAYIANDLRDGRKVFFHARLLNQLPGEMNLFVIRETAVKYAMHEWLVERLREIYEVITIKPVPWLTRMRVRGRMRRGNWRHGGKPRFAVVVFDHQPRPTSEDQRHLHAFVFNAKQLIKQEWREWFVNNTAAPKTADPIHSTDNEAEAGALLELFFTADEQAAIISRLRDLRGGGEGVIGKEAEARSGADPGYTSRSGPP
jgi:hypothetical protein